MISAAVFPSILFSMSPSMSTENVRGISSGSAGGTRVDVLGRCNSNFASPTLVTVAQKKKISRIQSYQWKSFKH
jgi:hypothetical protein